MAMYLGSNKVEIGTNSGGGGSGDFTTAEITFTNNTSNALNVSIPFIFEDNILVCTDSLVDDGIYLVPLYKNVAVAVAGNNVGISISVSGGVQYEAEDNAFTITGDGTITIDLEIPN